MAIDLYLDCTSGISGNMFLGALFDLGLDVVEWKKHISTLNLSGFELGISKKSKNGILGTYFSVSLGAHEHSHRGLMDIERLIQESPLSENVQQRSLSMFKRLAAVEAAIHNTTIQKIHFHEVGAIDSIIDIVGSAVALEMLDVENVYVSEIVLGSGTVQCAHGELAVPAPATVALLKDTEFAVQFGKGDGELVTPTGALILTEFATPVNPSLAFNVVNVGYGLGTRDIDMRANVLKIISIHRNQNRMLAVDEVVKIETNIDDMSPQLYEHVMDTLLSQGALDVFLVNVMMKKNRPGVLLTVFCNVLDRDNMLDILFRETTTLGVRIELIPRIVLSRETKAIKTSYGEVKVKIAKLDGDIRNVSFEYDDCKAIAKKHHIPLKKLYNDLWKEIKI